MGKSGLCSRGGRRHRLIAAAKEFLDFLFQVLERTVRQRSARIDNDVPRRGQILEPDAHNFADPSLKAIAQNGLANGSRRGEPDARPGPASGQTESRKQRPTVTEAVVVNFAEFAGS